MGIFKINEHVSLKSDLKRRGIILDKQVVGNDVYYTVRFEDQDEFCEESLLERYVDIYVSLKDMVKNRIFISLEDFKRKFLLAKIDFHLPDIFYESNSSVADFLPHQFRPLMKILDSDTGRLLIADEVGVGKTIESGYIISELLARNEIHSILVICPKNLIPKWILELKRFFNEEFEMINDSKDLIMKFEKRSKYSKLVVGLELLRRKEIVDKLAQGLLQNKEHDFQEFEPFDLVIFDEAHHLRNPETLSNKVAKLLLEDCEYSLFLTATPINTSLEDLMNLLNLLVYQGELTITEFDEIMEPNRSLIKIQILLDSQSPNYINEIQKELKKLSNGNTFSKLAYNQIKREGILIKFLDDDNFRSAEIRAKIRYSLEKINRLSSILNNTRKTDIADHESIFPIRHPEDPILIEFTASELEFYIKARAFFIDLIIRRAEGGFIPIQLVEVMPQRVVASSINGTFEKLRKMLDRHNEKLDQTEVIVDFEDLEYQETDIDLRSNPFLLTNSEVERIYELLDYESIIGDSDSKFDAVLERIRQYFLAGNSRILIFSYFKSTIEYVTKRLNNVDFTEEEKVLNHPIRAEYIHGDIKIPMREQIFRQFKNNQIDILILSEIGAEGIDLQFCNCLINYDLPWNPMKLEQRIGRLDRYGQKNAIFITNVYVKNSIEDRILHRLYKRLGMIRENMIYLNPVLQEYVKTRNKFFYSPERTEKELEESLKKIEENLSLMKKYREEIEEHLEEIKGDTGKALIHEQSLVEEKRNPFSLRELFETFDYVLNSEFPGSSFKLCDKNEKVFNYLKKKKISISPTLFYLDVTSDFVRELRGIEIHPESIKQQVEIFLNRIDNSKALPEKRRYKPILITHDKKLANKYRDQIDLISLKHILIKILLFFIKDKPFERIFTTLIPKKEFQFESILLVIYLLKIDGIRTDSKMEIVGYDVKTQSCLSKEVASQIYKNLLNNMFVLNPDFSISPELIEEGFNKSFSQIVVKKGQAEKVLKDKMKNIFEYKKEQINRRYDNKITHLTETLRKVRGKKIKRLFQGQIDKNVKRKNESLVNLKEKYEKSIVVSIVEVGSILIQKK
ncbi:RNA polymerase-associated protein RapA [subsurface metagenome]